MRFEKATSQDTEEILNLYKSVIGMEYCAWSDDYPGLAEIQYDLSRDSLYCLRQGGEIIGVITVDQDEMVEAVGCWSKELQPAAELSRLGVRPDYQNQGIACVLIEKVMEELKASGYRSIHYLVAKSNLKAQKSYAKLSPNRVGECQLFGEDWWCYEKEIDPSI